MGLSGPACGRALDLHKLFVRNTEGQSQLNAVIDARPVGLRWQFRPIQAISNASRGARTRSTGLNHKETCPIENHISRFQDWGLRGLLQHL
eukprot:6909416-Pyramimonas_sp.AAC.1